MHYHPTENPIPNERGNPTLPTIPPPARKPAAPFRLNFRPGAGG
jgi:hypothetical protein